MPTNNSIVSEGARHNFIANVWRQRMENFQTYKAKSFDCLGVCSLIHLTLQKLETFFHYNKSPRGRRDLLFQSYANCWKCISICILSIYIYIIKVNKHTIHIYVAQLVLVRDLNSMRSPMLSCLRASAYLSSNPKAWELRKPCFNSYSQPKAWELWQPLG